MPLGDVSIQDDFWKEYMELVRNHVIPYQWEALNDRIEGAEPVTVCRISVLPLVWRKAVFREWYFRTVMPISGWRLWPTRLMWHPDKELEATADEAIDIICAAQQPDGYLDTYYILNGLEKTLYKPYGSPRALLPGSYGEGAVAYYKATGKRKFLDTAIGYVNCVYEI